MQGAKLVLGVDRLDYSKGLANRVRAFDRMIEIEPQLKRTVSMLQVAVATRGAIRAYRDLKTELAALIGEVNGRHGEVDWTPIRYLNKSFSQLTLAGFYRTAHVGLVTPLQDGMNLVAKEYVAAQNPFDPGRAGAVGIRRRRQAARRRAAGQSARHRGHGASDRRGPHHAPRRTARALARDDRKLKASSVQAWFADFLRALEDARRVPSLLPAVRPAKVVDLSSRSARQRCAALTGAAMAPSSDSQCSWA